MMTDFAETLRLGKDKATRMARRLPTWVLAGARFAAAIAVTAAAASAEPMPAAGPATPAPPVATPVVAGGLLILEEPPAVAHLRGPRRLAAGTTAAQAPEKLREARGE